MAYTTAENVIKFLDDVKASEIDDLLIKYADNLIDELTERDFIKHENFEEREKIKVNNLDEVMVENSPLLNVNSIKVNDELIDDSLYVFQDWGLIEFDGLLLDKNDIAIYDYNYGYESVPTLVEQVSTLLVVEMFKQNKATASSGNSALIPKSKKFANYSISYGSVQDIIQSAKNSGSKNLTSLVDKTALLERNYRK